VSSLDLLSEYLLIMVLRFDAMLYSNLSNENCDADHIKCSRGPQVPYPCLIFWHDGTGPALASAGPKCET